MLANVGDSQIVIAKRRCKIRARGEPLLISIAVKAMVYGLGVVWNKSTHYICTQPNIWSALISSLFDTAFYTYHNLSLVWAKKGCCEGMGLCVNG